jgi:integrase/recombinase XerD
MTVVISRLSVIVYTRHSSKCHKRHDRYWRRCHCSKWLYINENSKHTLRSAKTRSWDRADELGRNLERELELLALQHPGSNSHRPRPVTLAKLDECEGSITLATAVARFLAAKKNENLEEATISKLTTIFQKKMLSWAASEQIRELDRIGASELERFRETWKDAPLSRKKKQERVVGFFYYCFRMGWIKTNPAVLLGKIRVREQPTDYFPKEEFEKIIQATYIYKPKAWNTEPCNQATRVRTLIRLMRWSGLSIRDAVGLDRSQLTNQDELFLYRVKPDIPSMSHCRRISRPICEMFRPDRNRILNIFLERQREAQIGSRRLAAQFKTRVRTGRNQACGW